MRSLPLFLVALLVPAAAAAHGGTGETAGFLQGLAHPFGGLDHVLAMVAVGFLAFLLGGRALWLVPAAFVVVMALGGALGVAGIALPHVELGIALSIVVLGAVVTFDRKLPVAAAMALVAAFAVFHGHAHGAEMPESAAGLAYALGFMLATALLHAAGIAAGFAVAWLAGARGPLLVRAGGGALALAGVALLGGML